MNAGSEGKWDIQIKSTGIEFTWGRVFIDASPVVAWNKRRPYSSYPAFYLVKVARRNSKS